MFVVEMDREVECKAVFESTEEFEFAGEQASVSARNDK